MVHSLAHWSSGVVVRATRSLPSVSRRMSGRSASPSRRVTSLSLAWICGHRHEGDVGQCARWASWLWRGARTRRCRPQTGQLACWPSSSGTRKVVQPLVLQKSRWLAARRMRRCAWVRRLMSAGACGVRVSIVVLSAGGATMVRSGQPVSSVPLDASRGGAVDHVGLASAGATPDCRCSTARGSGMLT